LHYECVRRNEEFRKGYAEWRCVSESEFSEELYLSILRDMLASRWGLLWGEPLPDPTQRPLLNYIATSSPSDSFQLPKENKVDPAARKGMETMQFHPPEKPPNLSVMAGLLVLNYYPEINPDLASRGIINLRFSKSSIMKSFENYLDVWLKERKVKGFQQRKPPRRVRLGEGIQQLTVYDLRAAGMPFSQIGATVFEKETGDREKKAKDLFRMAKRLIQNPPLLPS